MNIFKKIWMFITRAERLIDMSEEELEAISGSSHKETGHENADKFVKHIQKQTMLERRVVIEYGGKWPWMVNPEWRQYVINKLENERSVFTKVYFSGPDEYEDDWTFVGYVKDTSVSVKDLSLNDTIE